jgi:DNA-binding response OmpR family regulator
MVLEQGGFFVASAATPQDALRCLDELAFDVVLLDEGLWRSSARKPFLDRLRTDSPRTHVVVLCSNGSSTHLHNVISFDKGRNPGDLIHLLHVCVGKLR